MSPTLAPISTPLAPILGGTQLPVQHHPRPRSLPFPPCPPPLGSGKTQLIHSLLNSGGVGMSAEASGVDGSPPPPPPAPCPLVDPFEGATRRAGVVEGTVHGIRIVCVDTPGLVASAEATAYNGRVLQQIRRFVEGVGWRRARAGERKPAEITAQGAPPSILSLPVIPRFTF